MLSGSTIRVMHEIAGEERHPDSFLWTRALQLQATLDWSLWVRRVDIALIGGDPLLLARRVSTLLNEAPHGRALRIAIVHSGVFSGAPLSALEDPLFRREMSLNAPSDISDAEAPMAIVRKEIDRAAGLLNARGGGGVIAFEMAQGLFDADRGEVVLRLTRPEGEARRRGVKSSAKAQEQIMKSANEGRSSDLYTQSEKLFHQGLTEMRSRFLESLTEPPGGRRFADLIIAKRCELLSGFISPPSGRDGPLMESEVASMVGKPYCFAGSAPRRVSQAIAFWREDFGRATNVPISSLEKEPNT